MNSPNKGVGLRIEGYSAADQARTWMVWVQKNDPPQLLLDTLDGLVLITDPPSIMHGAVDFALEPPFMVRVAVGSWVRKLYTCDVKRVERWLGGAIKMAKAMIVCNQIVASSPKPVGALAAVQMAMAVEKAAFDKL